MNSVFLNYAIFGTLSKWELENENYKSMNYNDAFYLYLESHLGLLQYSKLKKKNGSYFNKFAINKDK